MIITNVLIFSTNTPNTLTFPSSWAAMRRQWYQTTLAAMANDRARSLVPHHAVDEHLPLYSYEL